MHCIVFQERIWVFKRCHFVFILDLAFLVLFGFLAYFAYDYLATLTSTKLTYAN